MAPHHFALTADALQGEWWRLWSGHLVHYSPGHFLLNAAAVLPPVVLSRSRTFLLGWVTLAAPLLSILILASGTLDEYRGASGIAAGLWAIVAIELWRTGERSLATVMATLLAAKLVLEASGSVPWGIGVETSVPAHYAGAVLGALGGWALGRIRRRDGSREGQNRSL